MLNGTDVHAHYSYDGGKTWNIATRDIVNNAFDGNVTCIMTSYGHLHNATKQQYLEITYTPAEPLPKVVVQSFVGAKAKGVVLKDAPTGILPSGRVLCVNKVTNELAKSYILDLVKIVESKNKRKLSKLTVVVMLENCLDDEQRLWLHHTDCVNFVEVKANPQPVGVTTSASRPNSETASRYSDHKSITCSEVSYSMGSFQRLGKCQGDFCSYCPDEDDPDIGAEDIMEGNVLDESRKARIRLRLATGRDASELQTKEKIVVVKTDDEPEGNDLLHVDVKPRDENNPYTDSNKDDDPDRVVVKKTQARFVPFKSISLARQDMSDLEDAGECHYSHSYVPWPELLFLWWWRQGRGLAQKKGSVPVPATSGHRIAVAKLSSNAATALSTVKPVPQASSIGATVTHNPSQPALASQSDASVPPVGLSKKSVHAKQNTDGNVPYDLSENSYSTPENIPNNKVGQLSWYYSDARVCETCYQVYRDIERRRKQKQNQLLKAQKRVASHDEEEKGKEIEKRIFQQRKFVSRLASIPRRSVDDIATSPTSKYPSLNPNFGSISTITGAPSNAVPPVPWKLSENNNRENYMRNGPSFVRHLPERVEQFQQMIYLDRLKNEHEIRRRKILGGDLDNDNDDINESVYLQEEQARWNEAVGNTNKENVNMQPKKKKSLRHPNPLTKKVSKNFNVDHLLHPWQRDMKQMREELDEVGYDHMVKYNIKNYTKKPGAMGVLKRTTSLPPLPQGLQQGSLANTSQITLDSALNEGSFSGAGFVGLGNHRHNVADKYTAKITSNITSNSNYAAAKSHANTAAHLDDDATASSSVKRNVSFDETSFRAKPSPAAVSSKSYAVTSNSYDVVTKAQQAIKSLTSAYDDDGEDDDDDDDDDEDEGIGWSPFVIPQT